MINKKALVWAVALAEQGVAWRPRKGAACPWCGQKMRVQNTRGDVRYCRCAKEGCIIRSLGLTVKAV